MDDQRTRNRISSAGARLLSRLKARGIDYVFVNSGTDFPPIIEGLAELASAGADIPELINVPHEHVAMGMAFGHHQLSGRCQATILHTNVGLANGVIGAINAAADNVPMILMSGRTPTTERGRFGARTVPIGWGQEMRDQTALVRESVKWDYELRFPEQVDEIVDRAWAIASSSPKGPVYLSLPREILAEAAEADIDAGATMVPAAAEAPFADIETAAEWLARARNPVIFAQRGAGSASGFASLTTLASEFAIPVVHYWATRIGLPTDHPMYAGTDPEPWLSEADVILVVDSLAPWSPDIHAPKADARVIQLGPNPLFSRTPVRNFRSDLSLATETSAGLTALHRAMRVHSGGGRPQREDRHAEISRRTARLREKAAETAAHGAGPVMSKAYVSWCLSRAIEDRKATVLSELGCPLAPLTLRDHAGWLQEPFSGGLGWSLPTAMGMKLADPDRLIVATMGDGSYIFANPVACHQVMEALSLGVVIVVLNNAGYGAVRESVAGMYPDGEAAQRNRFPLTELEPSPEFTRIAEASRAWARRVEDGRDLPVALAEAIAEAEKNLRPALVEVRVA